jgi:hypothetical protein
LITAGALAAIRHARAPSSAFKTLSVPGGLPLFRQHPIFRLEERLA